ncbi:MAG: hypothetical protein SOR57_06185 [Parabacteroides sp.]|nr:hypothetical protein [Parabacteroides sp.]
MKTKQDILEQLKDKEPFKVPEGYFDDLTNNIMQNLPEKEVEETETASVTMWDRLRPLLYLAAVFVGLGFFFKTVMPKDYDEQSKQLMVEKQSEDVLNQEDSISDIDKEYMEFQEEQYLKNLISESIIGQ